MDLKNNRKERRKENKGSRNEEDKTMNRYYVKRKKERANSEKESPYKH